MASDKIELEEGERLAVKNWRRDEVNGYFWSLRQHEDALVSWIAIAYERDGQYPHPTSFMTKMEDKWPAFMIVCLFGGEKRERVCLEVHDEAQGILDDIAVSCLRLKLRDQRSGIFGVSLGEQCVVRGKYNM